MGRVFCSSCGGKLDLTAMTSEAVADSVRPSWFKRHWSKFLAVIIILLLAAAGLALWPSAKPIGAAGKPVTGRRVQSDIKFLDRARKGQAIKRTFTEEGINGYFEFVAKRNLKAIVTVDVQEKWCMVRMVRHLGELDLKFYKVAVRFSYDLKCSAVGGRLVVRGVKMGHLPVIAPFKTMIVKDVYKRVSALPEWKPMTSLSEISMADDKISVVYKK